MPSWPVHSCITPKDGDAEFAGPENGGPKKNKDRKMQDLEIDGPNHRAGKHRTKSCGCYIVGTLTN